MEDQKKDYETRTRTTAAANMNKEQKMHGWQ